MEAVRDPAFGAVYRKHAQAVLEKLRQVMALLLAKTGSNADPASVALALRALSFGLMFADGNGEVVSGHAPGEPSACCCAASCRLRRRRSRELTVAIKPAGGRRIKNR